MKWIVSAGGPLLLLDARKLKQWGGIFDEIEDWPGRESFSPDGFATDYDRACQINGYLGSIPVGSSKAIVFSDEPLPTTWVPIPQGGVFVRCFYAESETPALDWLCNVPEDAFRDECTFNVASQRLVLFDAALAGRDVKQYPDEFLLLELAVGTYKVSTAEYQPDAQTSMLLHQFERC